MALVIAAALLVALLPPALSLVAIAGVAAVLAWLTKPVFGFYCLLFAVPFESVRNVQAGGLNVTITEIVVFCVSAAWLCGGITRGRLGVGRTPWRFGLLVYGAVIAISITQAHNFALSAKEMLKWGELLLAYLIGMTLVRTPGDLRRLLIVMCIAVIAESSVGVAQTVLHSGPSSFGRGAFLRSSGTFEQPNPFAGYLNMVLPLAVALLAYRVFPRRAMWFVVAVVALGVLTSLSRGGQLALAIALTTMAALALPRSRVLIGIAVVALIAVVAGVAVGLVPSTVTDPLAQGFGVANVDVVNPTPENWAVAERLAHMEAGLGMWSDHLFLGVGIGNYGAAYDRYKVAAVWENALGHAHNYYINIGAEAGLLGLAAFVLLLGTAIAIAVRAYRRSTTPLERAVGLGSVGVMVGISVHSFFDDVFVHGMEVQMALVMVAASRVAAGFTRESGA